jgi:hypothetical protein
MGEPFNDERLILLRLDAASQFAQIAFDFWHALDWN